MCDKKVRTLKCPAEIISYMHDYLDDDISVEHENVLREHINNCMECKTHFHQLKKTIALVQSTAHIKAPKDFTANVMAMLPKDEKKHRWKLKHWFMSHPVLTAVSMFLVLMGGSLLSVWSGEQQFSVSKQPNLIVNNNTVIVPEGEIVKGDVVVKNGTLKIEGEVDGNVTIINGEQYRASAGNVTGDIEEINEVFEWIWYHVKSTGKDMLNMFGEEKNTATN